MADKEIIMVLNVDLQCERCKKKIKRVLHKIKVGFVLDEKKNLVIISGPFDAEKVRRKLCCKAGRIIKGIEVKVPKENEDRGRENAEDRRTTAAAPSVNVNLRPLLEKMLERPKARTKLAPCTCCSGCRCGKQTSQPPQPAAPVAVAAPSVWPAPAKSVSDYGYDYEAPYLCYAYGVPVYNIEGWQ